MKKIACYFHGVNSLLNERVLSFYSWGVPLCHTMSVGAKGMTLRVGEVAENFVRLFTIMLSERCCDFYHHNNRREGFF